MKHKIVLRSVFILLFILFATGLAQAGDPQRGRQIYFDRCSGCHGFDGIPTMNYVPAFGRGDRMNKPDRDLMMLIKRGKGVMPGYEGMLTDIEILDTLAYIRTLF